MTGRKARRSRSRLLANRLVLAVLVLAALAALYGLAGLSAPIALSSAATAGAVSTAPVTSAVLACPAPGLGGVTAGGVAVASAPRGTGTGGQIMMTSLGAAASTSKKSINDLHVLTTPDQLAVTRVPTAAAVPKTLAAGHLMAGGLVPSVPGRGGVQIAALGPMAQGLDAEQLSPDGEPSARCQAPGTDFWFIGPMSTGMRVELYLMNTDSVPADVSVQVLTDSGTQPGVTPDSGIAVPPHSVVVQQLDRLLRGAKVVALHITTSSGRIVPAAREATARGQEGAWLPIAQAPATQQVLAGLPRLSGTRELFIASPSDARNAIVKLTAITSNGSYQPTGGSGIDLPGSSAMEISLPSLNGIPAAIRVSSNVPVTAALMLSGGPGGAPGAFIAASEPIQQQGVVAANPVGGHTATSLVLSAPGRAATVKIIQAPAGTALNSQTGTTVQIKARSSTVFPLTGPRRSAKGVLVTVVVIPQSGSGPVYAASVSGTGSLVRAILPVITSPVYVPLPDVQNSLVTILK